MSEEADGRAVVAFWTNMVVHRKDGHRGVLRTKRHKEKNRLSIQRSPRGGNPGRLLCCVENRFFLLVALIFLSQSTEAANFFRFSC